MRPKYNLLNFTESYRHAERRHTVLLPLAMALVVGVSFWLVVQSRPGSDPVGSDPPDDSGQGGASPGPASISAPPKIEFEFGSVLEEIPVVDPGFDISQAKSVAREKEVPPARAIPEKKTESQEEGAIVPCAHRPRQPAPAR